MSQEDVELSELAELNMTTALDVWAGAADGGGFAASRDGCMAWCSAPLRSFNHVVPTRVGGLRQ